MTFLCIYCENIQTSKNTANHLHVCEEYLSEIGRYQQVGSNKKACRDTSRWYYNSLKAHRIHFAGGVNDISSSFVV
jgi:hypothetical protein